MQKSILILGLASLIGLTGDSLLKNTICTGIPIGLGIPLFIQTLAVATIFLAYKTNMPLGRKGLCFLIPALIFSLGFIFRDSPTLLAIDLGVIVLSLTFTILSLMGQGLTTAGISAYLSALGNGLLMSLMNASDLLYNCIDWDRLIPQAAAIHARSVMRGLVIGLPITAVFLALFVSADAAFAAIVGKSIRFDLGDMTQHSLVVGTISWIATGYFHSFTLNKYAQASEFSLSVEGERPPAFKLGITEIATALALVNLLFAAFVSVQLRFLFGGASLIELTPGLSFAEYARKGFFDLNIAAALVLPMLLCADHLIDHTSKISLIILRGLSITLLALLLVVMASALMRMHLYQTEYGQSELRLYTTAFMAWLALVCVIFGGTVLTGLRKYFAFSSFVAGLSIISVLHWINPDAMTERANISHAKTGKIFDAAYAISLSNDGVPTLVKNISGLPREQQRIIARALVNQHKGAWHTDWRAFNLSRMQAYQAVSENMTNLVQLARD